MGQIADLLLAIPGSRSSVLGYQQRLRGVTTYHQAGYEVRWLLGEELWLNGRLTDLQRDFLYFTAKIGFHLWELDWK
ncbi:MAG: hypothetical protein ACLTZB_00680 [Streptococcus salivarius]